MPGKTYRTDLGYQPNSGRLLTLSYPEAAGRQRFTRQSTYNVRGLLEEIGEQASVGQPYRMFHHIDLRSLHASQDTLGNGVRLNQAFNDLMGRLKASQAVLHNPTTSKSLLTLDYGYHANGMVRERITGNPLHQRKDTFDYDSLQRLTGWGLEHKFSDNGTWSKAPATHYEYDRVGNMLNIQKDGTTVEQFTYGSRRPHALTQRTHKDTSGHVVTTAYAYDARGRQQSSAGQQINYTAFDLPHKDTSGHVVTTAYAYDARGRQQSSAGQQINYTAFDLPKSLQKGNVTWKFAYDAFGNRIKKRQIDRNGNTLSRTFYLPGLSEERQQTGQPTLHVFHVGVAEVSYIEAPGVADPVTVNYTLRDALGSVSLTIDGNGQHGTPIYYEPFGQRINADGSLATVRSAWSRPALRGMRWRRSSG